LNEFLIDWKACSLSRKMTSIRKHYYELGLELGLTEIFQSNIFSSKCSRTL